MSANVFISFASQDRKVALTLCSALENRGFNCWISARDIQPGENFQTAIVKAIRQAKIMLLVFTANSNTSEEMTKELALASQFKVMVVPLRIEDVAPSDAFAYEFATRQWIDFFSDWELAVQQLSRRIEYAVTQPAAAAKLAAAAASDVLDDPIKEEAKTVEAAPALKAKPAPKAKADEPAAPKMASLMSGSGAPETPAAAALDKRTPAPKPAAAAAANEPKKSNKGLLIAAGVLGALAVVGGIAAVTVMNKPAADAEPEVMTVDPTPATPITTTITGPVPETGLAPAAAAPTAPGVPPGALPPGAALPSGAVAPKTPAAKRYNKVDTGGATSAAPSSPSAPSRSNAPSKQEPTVLY